MVNKIRKLSCAYWTWNFFTVKLPITLPWRKKYTSHTFTNYSLNRMLIHSTTVIYVFIPVILASFTLICCQRGALQCVTRKQRESSEMIVQSVNALPFLMGECDRLWTDEGEISARTVSKCDIRNFNRVADSGTLL